MTFPIVFYFPWREASGGPVYLTSIARRLAEVYSGKVYYTDFKDGITDPMLEGSSVEKLELEDGVFGVALQEPVILVTPIYWAHWLPELHPDSKIIFVNWHNLCVPVLKDSWNIDSDRLLEFLQTVSDNHAVFFCDAAHRQAQMDYGIPFDENYVPIGIEPSPTRKTNYVAPKGELKIAILGRLSIDKVFAVTNLARHLDAYPFEGTKTLYVIGNGPEENRIVPEDYPSVNIVFTGPMFDEKLDAFLIENVDVMFAMGTSALASGRLAIPTVVVCNEIHDYDDDIFVYLQEAKGFCLGWQVEQAPSFDIPIRTCAEILDDMRDAKKQKELGDSVHQYVSEFHNAKFAADEFLKAATKSTLTFRSAKDVFLGWQIEKKTYRLGFKGKLRAVRYTNDMLELRYKDKLIRRMKFKGLEYKLWLLLIGVIAIAAFPLTLLLIGANMFRKAKKNSRATRALNTQLFDLATNQVPALNHKLDRQHAEIESQARRLEDQAERLDAQTNELEKQTSRVESQSQRIEALKFEVVQEVNQNTYATVLGQPTSYVNNGAYIAQMDTCDSIIDQASYEQFSGDVEQLYLDLIAGMDDESRRIITRVLKRLRDYSIYKAGTFQLTREEEDKFRELMDFHYDRILRLSDKWYLYDGKYRLPSADISSTVFYYKHFLTELERPAALKKKAMIDVGAYFGDSVLIMREFTDGEIWAVEPSRENFDLLNETINQNGLKDVRPLNIGLGSKPSEMVVLDRGDQSSLVTATDGQSIERDTISVQTLDSLVDEHGIEVGLIKIDVEGMEFDVLEGARKTILEQKPVLLISIYHNFDQFFKARKWVEELGVEYDFKIRKPLDMSIAVDTNLICEPRVEDR
ncbi:FkbM family methyltransferase [Ruegeria atlantica]|uniref:FkbM family methyltransferase n=1 Tax=Ruegeria atlantica TaxID=81569 RepID=UPI00147C92C7|nr:FkbM family methyltransferase [Ruegeria atlantica]